VVAHPAGGHPAMAGPLQHPVWFRLCRVRVIPGNEKGWEKEKAFPKKETGMTLSVRNKKRLFFGDISCKEN